jgi:repressor LexA
VSITSENIFDKISKKASDRGISINSLEKKAGIATGSVYKWNTVSPTVRNLSKVAGVLDCTVDELLE